MTYRIEIPLALSSNQLSFIEAMVNDVYEESEKLFWKKNHQRTSVAHLKKHLKYSELIVAFADEEIAACVVIRNVDASTCIFQMLTANPNYKGKGLGSLMLAEVEEEARRRGAHTMRLELLEPLDQVIQDKVFLDSWYRKVGYAPVKRCSIDDIHQGESENLAIACDVVVYEKAL